MVKLPLTNEEGNGGVVPVFAIPAALQVDRAPMNERRKLGRR
jgi:hypothetical protein